MTSDMQTRFSIAILDTCRELSRKPEGDTWPHHLRSVLGYQQRYAYVLILITMCLLVGVLVQQPVTS